jgi:DNA-binding NarL/FixJ family response regulator
LRAGAQGYLHKGRATRQLLDAIRALLAEKMYVSGELADELLHRVVGSKAAERSPIDRLSDRELEAFRKTKTLRKKLSAGSVNWCVR